LVLCYISDCTEIISGLKRKITEKKKYKRTVIASCSVFFFWRSNYFCSKWEQFPPKIPQRGQPPLATALA
jgi:hypothetical protein